MSKQKTDNLPDPDKIQFTLLKPEDRFIGYCFDYLEDQECLLKTEKGFSNSYDAETVSVTLNEFEHLVNRGDFKVIMPTVHISEWREFQIVSEMKYESIERDLRNKICTRKKDNFKHTNLLVLSTTCSDNMPDKLKAMSINDLYGELCRIVPDFINVAHVRVPGSSYGIYKDGKLVSDESSWNCYFKLEDPDSLESFTKSLKIKMVAGNFYWLERTKQDEQIVRFPFDVTYFDKNKIILESIPELSEGLERKSPPAEYIDGTDLKLTSDSVVSLKEVKDCQKKLGLKVSRGVSDLDAKIKMLSYDLFPRVRFHLSVNTILEDANKTEFTVEEFYESSDVSRFCYSPIRKEQTPSCFIARDADKIPYCCDPVIGLSWSLDSCECQKIGIFLPVLPGTMVPHEYIPDVIYFGEFSRPNSTIENLLGLLKFYGIKLKTNDIAKKMEIDFQNTYRDLNHIDNGAKMGFINSLCHRNEIPVQENMLYLKSISDQNRYNPVKNWILSKEWDGVNRLKLLFQSIEMDLESYGSYDDQDFWDIERFELYKDNDSDDFFDTYYDPHDKGKHVSAFQCRLSIYNFFYVLFKKWMAGAAALGCGVKDFQFDNVLVFVGKQGIGKTRFFRSLCDDKEWRKDGVVFNPKDKDSVFGVISYWLVELGELDATFRKADIASLKAFLSKQDDEMRLPYARVTSKYKRSTAFVASVNDQTFLRDDTGNRRYWPFPVIKLNEKHGQDMQQVWAQAYAEFKKGEIKPYLLPEESKYLANIQDLFQPPCPFTSSIRDCFDTKSEQRDKWYTATEILKVIQMPINHKNQRGVAKVCRDIFNFETNRDSKGRRFHLPRRHFNELYYKDPEQMKEDQEKFDKELEEFKDKHSIDDSDSKK